jgi:hypothetical protein
VLNRQIGVEFATRSVNTQDGKTIKAQIWDTGECMCNPLTQAVALSLP